MEKNDMNINELNLNENIDYQIILFDLLPSYLPIGMNGSWNLYTMSKRLDTLIQGDKHPLLSNSIRQNLMLFYDLNVWDSIIENNKIKKNEEFTLPERLPNIFPDSDLEINLLSLENSKQAQDDISTIKIKEEKEVINPPIENRSLRKNKRKMAIHTPISSPRRTKRKTKTPKKV